jgi:hypothetical protein
LLVVVVSNIEERASNALDVLLRQHIVALEALATTWSVFSSLQSDLPVLPALAIDLTLSWGDQMLKFIWNIS